MSGYKHKPDINYEVLEVTPKEDPGTVKAEDEQWEKPERLLALAHSYKTPSQGGPEAVVQPQRQSDSGSTEQSLGGGGTRTS